MNENDKTEILEPVETPAENITEPSKDGRKCPKWLPPLVAAVCAVILVAAGIVGWNAYSGAKLAEAKEAMKKNRNRAERRAGMIVCAACVVRNAA